MINEQQHQLLIGALLGDSHVECQGKNCRIIFEHSSVQLEYLKWKFLMLQPFCTKIVKKDVLDQRNHKIYHKFCFKTLTRPFFNQYRELFYEGSKKVVPIPIRQDLRSQLALAVWYLDDGSLRSDCRGLRIHTNSFSLQEVQTLRETLLENFSIKSTLHKQGQESWNLYIGSANKQSEKFCDIIRPIVASKIPSMLFKLLKPCND